MGCAFPTSGDQKMPLSPPPHFYLTKTDHQANKNHQSMGTKAKLSISPPPWPHAHNPANTCVALRETCQRTLSCPEIQVQRAVYPLTRGEFLCTPELEGFEFVTIVLGASQK